MAGLRKALRWMEFLAVIPASIVLPPLMYFGMIAALLSLAGVWLGSERLLMKLAMAKSMLVLVAQIVAGITSLTCLWFLLVAGVSRVRHTRWRVLSIVVLLLGIADAAYDLLADPSATKEMLSDTCSIVMRGLIIALPMLLGMRYVYLLLRPSGGSGSVIQ